MEGWVESFFFIEENIFIEVLPPNKGKAKVWNVFVEGEGKIFPHFPKNPVKDDPNG